MMIIMLYFLFILSEIEISCFLERNLFVFDLSPDFRFDFDLDDIIIDDLILF